MPVSEVFDYIQLINKQTEEEQEASKASAPAAKNETPTLSDVYRGPFTM